VIVVVVTVTVVIVVVVTVTVVIVVVVTVTAVIVVVVTVTVVVVIGPGGTVIEAPPRKLRRRRPATAVEPLRASTRSSRRSARSNPQRFDGAKDGRKPVLLPSGVFGGAS
jgi:hypothetical protein